MEVTGPLKSKRWMPASIASLPMLYLEKYGKVLQAGGYLTESQRHGKADFSLTKLLARLESIQLMDRPHGQHAVVLAEEASKCMYRNERSGGGNVVCYGNKSGSLPPFLSPPTPFHLADELIEEKASGSHPLLRLMETASSHPFPGLPAPDGFRPRHLHDTILGSSSPRASDGIRGPIGRGVDGDTALHVAVVRRDEEVLVALVKRNRDLLGAKSKQGGIPPHKAALFGQGRIFWKLVEHGSSVEARNKDGSMMSHCAVMGGAPADSWLNYWLQNGAPLLIFMKHRTAIGRDDSWKF